MDPESHWGRESHLTMQIAFVDLTLHAIQFAAIIGDLHHKEVVYKRFMSFESNVTCLFANCEQAHFLRVFTPSLIPPGNWNNHSLGTFFEFYFQSNISFEFTYLTVLPELTCVC